MLFSLLAFLGLIPTFQKTKCKRLLNTTIERIKLLRKRREARLRQLHRDVIELRQRGKEYKVQPWLERIWKELCLFSVHSKIAEYCQSMQSNLKEIAGQRECPSGLEEAIAGLCFAASCCADLPELQELRKIFAMKYGKQFVDPAQELQPSCYVTQQFLECLCPTDPSAEQKQALLEEITTQYNVEQGHMQDTLQLETEDSLSTEEFVDAEECMLSQEDTTRASEVKDLSESEELQEIDAVQESNDMESTLCEGDSGSIESANRKRTLEAGGETCRAAWKRTYRRRKFGVNKGGEEEENGGKEHEKMGEKTHDCAALEEEGMNEDVAPNEDQHMLPRAEQPAMSQPPHRPPPPPPPPKRAPPPLPSLCDNATNTHLPLRCSTMANNYFLELYGSHVHPRLPKYEDLVANFAAWKQQ